MTKLQFQAAAKRVAIEKGEVEGEETEDPTILEFSIAGQDFVVDLPTNTQVVLLSTGGSSGRMRDMLAASLEFLEGILHDDGYKRIRKLIANGTISTDLLLGGDDLNENGIIDSIIEAVSDGRPPTRSTGSSPSQKPGGQRSTGRAPGKGSIPSTSPSAASST